MLSIRYVTASNSETALKKKHTVFQTKTQKCLLVIFYVNSNIHNKRVVILLRYCFNYVQITPAFLQSYTFSSLVTLC